MNHRVPATNNVTDAGPLNFNYFRAHVGKQAGGKRTGKHLLEGQDLDAVQRAPDLELAVTVTSSLLNRLERLELLERLERNGRFKKFQPFQSFQP